ncbi:SoxR reducing system RseC family protein, partial [Enterococcus faecium]|uniref:SoxR reducing system RseC family protein n=1 Tax=Enterococcus faecium TaxID=1352 RepID=UPI00211EF17A
MNELVPETEHRRQVHIDQPLEPGQRVEVGIAEGSLLRSAMLVYLTPLLGMMLGGTLLQYCFGSDASAAIGAVLGGGAAFMLARRLARRLGEQADYQPVVLQIGLPPTAMPMQAENPPPLYTDGRGLDGVGSPGVRCWILGSTTPLNDTALCR